MKPGSISGGGRDLQVVDLAAVRVGHFNDTHVLRDVQADRSRDRRWLAATDGVAKLAATRRDW